MQCHFITFVQTAKFLFCDCLTIFDQARIARWRYYSGDTIVQSVHVYNFAVKFRTMAEKTAKKILGGYFLPHPVDSCATRMHFVLYFLFFFARRPLNKNILVP